MENDLYAASSAWIDRGFEDSVNFRLTKPSDQVVIVNIAGILGKMIAIDNLRKRDIEWRSDRVQQQWIGEGSKALKQHAQDTRHAACMVIA